MITKDELNQIGDLMDNRLNKQLKKTKQEILRAVRKSQNEIIAFFSDNYLELRKRVERIEDFLHLPPIES